MPQLRQATAGRRIPSVMIGVAATTPKNEGLFSEPPFSWRIRRKAAWPAPPHRQLHLLPCPRKLLWACLAPGLSIVAATLPYQGPARWAVGRPGGVRSL